MNDPNLRPLTLPSLSPSLTRLSNLKSEISFLHSKVDQYSKLAHKLETFSDEPTWNAYVPFGPLAYFPGQLVHTNDITQTVSVPGEGTEAKEGESKQAGQTKTVLRSAKQARLEAERLRKESVAQIESLTKEITALEADLRKEREESRKTGKRGNEGAALGLGEDEDWTVNERGEVINEDGLPIFDIREDLPPEPEAAPASVSSASKESETPGKKPMRYLVKKGGKQVVRPLKSSSSPVKSLAPEPTTSAPAKSAPAFAASPVAAAKSSEPALSFLSHDAQKLDIRAILDELEAEEEAERQKTEQTDREEQDKLIAADESKVAEDKAVEPSKKADERTKESGAFGGFSAGFLSKSKQKRPSNSLVSSPPAASRPPTSAPTTARTPASPPPPTPAQLPSSPLKSSLSRSTSRAASPAPGSKKSVAFDLPVPDDQVPTREGTSKKQAIVLGMGPTPAEPAPTPSQTTEAPVPQKKADFVRPIKDLVVEKPLRKSTPPGASTAGDSKPKKVSRFRKMKEDVLEQEEEPKGKGKAKEIVIPPTVRTSSSAPSPAPPPSEPAMPAPVHTISLSSKPSPSSSTSQPRNPDGTVSYADIPFSSDEEDPHLSAEEEEEEDDEDWYPSEDEEFDEEDFDVDAALHQREVALEYHRQRLGLAAGRGTGALGGYHNGEESPFAEVVAQQGLVPSDATLDSLSSHLTHAAALGKPSRFRTSNKHLESASLIIPSVLASDPSLTKSHTMLGPAPTTSTTSGREELEAEEEERMRRTLEALVEGRPLPEDEQLKEREKEIALREEYARSKDSIQRTAGKAPPTIKEVRERVPTVIDVPRNPERKEVGVPAGGSGEVEKRDAASPPTAAPAASGSEAVEEQPKKMSRFRMKQLGLID
ncbi:hypothetical protein JCM16303_001792 [Sporobolomyces ruberrimus]